LLGSITQFEGFDFLLYGKRRAVSGSPELQSPRGLSATMRHTQRMVAKVPVFGIESKIAGNKQNPLF